MTILNISGHKAISNVLTEKVQEYNVQDVQIKLITEMLVKLVEKLDQLEQKLNGRKILHLKQRRKGRLREVICHVCKQPGHYARGCAVKRIQSATIETSPPPSEAHECIHDSNQYIITINSV